MNPDKHELQYFSSLTFLCLFAATVAFSIYLKFAGYYPRFSWIQVLGFPSIFAAVFLAPFAPTRLCALSWLIGVVALVAILVSEA